MKTTTPVEYHEAPYGLIAIIPKDTELTPASNLPNYKEDNLFWAQEWEDMTDKEKSWKENYGFLIKMK